MYVISHRGNNNHKYRENTLEAIKEVLKYDYIDGVEFDIRMTKDNKFVLSHSPIYKDDLIKNKKQKEINLEELNYVLKNIETNKIILVDIKYELFDYKKVALYLNKVLKKYKRLNIYICSFNYDLVLKVKKTYPHLKVGLIIGYKMNENKDITPFDFISVHYNSVDKYKKEHFIWTINNINHLNNINDNLGIITDNSYILNKKETNNSF